MSKLSAFFRDADTRFGIFYPKDYLLAIFPNFLDADRAKKKLIDSGTPDEDSIAVTGEEVVHYAEESLFKKGLWGVLMTELSRVIDTEAAYADKDLAMAKLGAAFIAVHCPTEVTKTAAWKCIEPTHPSVARYYHFGGIEHLTGET
jgi:hypothetical protein